MSEMRPRTDAGDDHSLVLDVDGSLDGCSAVSVSFVNCFSDSFSESLSLWDDAPSSTSTSCVRGDEVTQEVQMKVMRSKNEILRRFADCLPSLLPDREDDFSLLDPMPFPLFLLFLRRERVFTGTVNEDVVKEDLSFSCLWLDSGGASGLRGAIDASVWLAGFAGVSEVFRLEAVWLG